MFEHHWVSLGHSVVEVGPANISAIQLYPPLSPSLSHPSPPPPSHTHAHTEEPGLVFEHHGVSLGHSVVEVGPANISGIELYPSLNPPPPLSVTPNPPPSSHTHAHTGEPRLVFEHHGVSLGHSVVKVGPANISGIVLYPLSPSPPPSLPLSLSPPHPPPTSHTRTHRGTRPGV